MFTLVISPYVNDLIKVKYNRNVVKKSKNLSNFDQGILFKFLRSQTRLWLRHGAIDKEEERRKNFMHFFQTKTFVPPW